MALDLEKYYETDLPEREALQEAVNTGITQLLHLFETVEFSSSSKGSGWRYFVGEDPQSGSPAFSQSTTSMIAAAIEGAHGAPRMRSAHGYHWHPSSRLSPKVTPELQRRVDFAKKRLLAEWQKRTGSNSSTYGINDILTLSWYVDLFGGDPTAKALLDKLTDILVERCTAILTTDEAADPSKALNDGFKGGDRVGGSTVYILLRFVRCERTLPKSNNAEAQAARTKLRKKACDRFQAGLRDQLSYGDVNDSRFDPCELAFCLEGMLHLRPDTVDDATAHRVFNVIHDMQQRMAGWRPQTPLTTSHRGEVLYAIGIEAATSILCSLSILDVRAPRRRSTALGHVHLRLILRYWDWLKARRLSIVLPKGSGEVTGWRSERLGGSFLHIWENSQIMEFLVIFRDYLDQHVAGELLELSELDVYLPAGEPDPWATVQANFEPVLAGDPQFQFYDAIGKEFVAPRLNNQGEPLWSMMLFGPPGTGKTTTAKKLAEALRLPMIRVTVSDFLTTGDGQMERRAKLIFEVLRRQMMSVVLFDELDQFLLDRDSELFGKQESAYQLLTPGMLTKIADLRAAENVIFILATNYDDRIDSAIKRSGRVDKQYLCLPPDFERRKKVISDTLAKRSLSIGAGDLAAAARNSVFLSYTDVLRLAKRTSDPSTLANAYDHEPRDIQFNKFSERAKDLLAAEKPPVELMGLTALALQALPAGDDTAPRFVRRLAALLKGLDGDADKVRELGSFKKTAFQSLIVAANS